MSTAEPTDSKWKLWVGLIVGLIIVTGLWYGSGLYINHKYPGDTAHGTFGDMFGAINALFSGYAFLGVIITILMQSKELEYQRIELKNSVDAQKDSADALTKQWKINRFSTEMNSINTMINHLNEELERFRRKSVMNPNEADEYRRLQAEKGGYIRDLYQAMATYNTSKEELYGK